MQIPNIRPKLVDPYYKEPTTTALEDVIGIPPIEPPAAMAAAKLLKLDCMADVGSALAWIIAEPEANETMEKFSVEENKIPANILKKNINLPKKNFRVTASTIVKLYRFFFTQFHPWIV